MGTLTLRDLSVPLSVLNSGDRSDTASVAAAELSYTNVLSAVVNQQGNYGLRLDGKGNAVNSANLQLNGHDRMSVREGSYFNYYTTRAHTRTPCDGVNVYSFALNPETHQPSGTCNMSRIDSTLLVVSFADSLRASANFKLDYGKDSLFYVFAVNYNVLRIMSGMGGLAYSN